MVKDNAAGLQATTVEHSSGHYVWFVVLTLTVVNVFNYVDRMALAVLAPLIQADMRLSDAQLGVLIGFAFAIFYAICGIPIARWADRGTRRNIIVLALATWSFFTAISGAAQNFWQLFLARVGVGAGEAGCFPPASSMLCDYVPMQQRSGIFAVHTFGIYAGMMLGMVLAGWLGETIGWRWTFVALGLPGFILAILVKSAVREPQRGSFDALRSDATSLPFGQTVRALWLCRTYRLLVIFLVVNGFVQYGLNQWWPSFYTRLFGLNLSTVGFYLGIAIGSGSGIGLLIGGLLANRAAKRDVRLPLLIGAASTSVVLPMALGTVLASSAFSSLVFVGLTAAAWTVSLGPVLAIMYSVTMPHMRATAGALYIFFMSVFGYGMGPFLVGLVSDLLAPSLGMESLRYAMLVPIALLPVMILTLYAAAKALPNDLAAMGGYAHGGEAAAVNNMDARNRETARVVAGAIGAESK